MSQVSTAAANDRTTGSAAKVLPYTGREYLDSLDDGREIWIYGERVDKITEHPAFQNCARMIARLYDALHEDHTSGKNILTMPTEWGGFTHRYFKAPTSLEEQVAGATRSPLGRVSPTAGSAARPITRRRSSERLAPMPSSMRPTRTTRGAGIASARSVCPSSTTRSFIRRSIAMSRRAHPERAKMSIAMSPRRPTPGSL